ncbi:MAG: CHAD domain-containing protein, partial [Candidatus Dadabacteria bacterium]|nr:CHAD domain-containing protein [Candidatus Dadabacteria bacterium]
RYLIDTFKSLYPEDEILVARKCLKRLQDNLGEITDMHVQRDLLDHWKFALAENKRIPQVTIEAIDEL